MTFIVPEAVKPISLKATHALVFHQGSASQQNRFEKTALITRHPVLYTSSGPVIGAGSMLSLSDQEILRDILNNNTDPESSLLPENVLVSTARRLAWYVPGAVRAMYISFNSRTKRLMVPWPTLVIRVDSGKLSVAALAASKRPEAKTRLYHAPIANTYDDGSVCTGGADIPGGWRLAHVRAWEKVLYDTAFSHVNQPMTLNLGKKDGVTDSVHFAFWRHLASKKETKVWKFPVKALVPMKCTLGQWLSRENDR